MKSLAHHLASIDVEHAEDCACRLESFAENGRMLFKLVPRFENADTEAERGAPTGADDRVPAAARYPAEFVGRHGDLWSLRQTADLRRSGARSLAGALTNRDLVSTMSSIHHGNEMGIGRSAGSAAGTSGPRCCPSRLGRGQSNMSTRLEGPRDPATDY